MASCVMTLTAELDLLHDAVDEIELIMRALVKCHGAQYRALERRIEALAEPGQTWSPPKMHMLSEGKIVVEPFSVMKSIIRDAREMGVI